jgi:cytochrome P450
VAGADLGAPQALPVLRACVLESLRLWPTIPAVLRDTTAATTWGGDELPAGTSVVVFAPFLHRDDRDHEEAHRFAPEVWLDGDLGEWPLIPFSGGPGACPGRDLVLLVATTVLAAVLERGSVVLRPPHRLDASRPLPGTLDPFRLRFRIG